MKSADLLYFLSVRKGVAYLCAQYAVIVLSRVVGDDVRLADVNVALVVQHACVCADVDDVANDLGLKTFRETDGKLKDKLDATNKAFAPYRENMQAASKIAKERTFRYMNPRTFSVFRKIIKSCNAAVESTTPNDTPTFITWGKLDELVPERTVKYLAKHFQRAEIKIYSDVGHAMLYTNLDDVIIHDIVAFLSEGKVLLEVPKR